MNLKQASKIRWMIFIILLVGALLAGNFMAKHLISPVMWRWWGEVITTEGVAMKGYDPVSFFGSQRAVRGTEKFQYKWKGVNWHFSSAAHKNAFMENPVHYAPQFGGYCASGVSYGVTARANPDAWHIHNGKLYLFGSEKVRQSWLRKLDKGIVERAEYFWNL